MARPKRTLQDLGLPPWGRSCTGKSRHAHQTYKCRAPAVAGSDRCSSHGGKGGVWKEQAWRYYLLNLLLPDAAAKVPRFRGPVTDDLIQILCQVIAEAALTGTTMASQNVKFRAAEFLLDSAALVTHPDPALLLTHLSRDDAAMAVSILVRNGLMKPPA
jgi:hypothetical protein